MANSQEIGINRVANKIEQLTFRLDFSERNVVDSILGEQHTGYTRVAGVIKCEYDKRDIGVLYVFVEDVGKPSRITMAERTIGARLEQICVRLEHVRAFKSAAKAITGSRDGNLIMVNLAEGDLDQKIGFKKVEKFLELVNMVAWFEARTAKNNPRLINIVVADNQRPHGDWGVRKNMDLIHNILEKQMLAKWTDVDREFRRYNDSPLG